MTFKRASCLGKNCLSIDRKITDADKAVLRGRVHCLKSVVLEDVQIDELFRKFKEEMPINHSNCVVYTHWMSMCLIDLGISHEIIRIRGESQRAYMKGREDHKWWRHLAVCLQGKSGLFVLDPKFDLPLLESDWKDKFFFESTQKISPDSSGEDYSFEEGVAELEYRRALLAFLFTNKALISEENITMVIGMFTSFEGSGLSDQQLSEKLQPELKRWR